MPNRGLFLKIDGVTGACCEDKHKGAIELLSYSIAAGSADGKPHISELNCTATASPADAKLWKACCDRDVKIKEVVLTCRAGASDKHDYNIVTLSNCQVLSVVEGGNGKSNAGDRELAGVPQPNESVAFSISFEKIEKKIHEIKQDGSLGAAAKFGFDRRTGKTL